MSLAGGAAAAWPLAARAQQREMPVIGILSLPSPNPTSGGAAYFRQALAKAGYVVGQNVAIEFRSANYDSSLLPRLSADLVRRQVAVIVTSGGYATFAAKAATSTIPIVFITNADPVSFGLVASLSRPGGNMTGAALLTTALVGKQLDLLREMVPRATTFTYLTDSQIRTAAETTSDIAAAARAMNRDLTIAEA